MLKLARTQKEVDDVLNRCCDWDNKGGTAYRGMTYEQGVAAGIKWVIGEEDDHSVEECPEED